MALSAVVAQTATTTADAAASVGSSDAMTAFWATLAVVVFALIAAYYLRDG